MPENVTHGNGFLRYIKARTTPALTPEQVQTIIDKIEGGRLERTLKITATMWPMSNASWPRRPQRHPVPSAVAPWFPRQAARGANAGNNFIWGCPRYPACRGLIEQD